MRTMLRLLVAIVLIVPTIASAEANDLLSEFAVQQGLEMEQVATDLAFPMGLVPLPDGSLLIATSPSESGNFYDSSGEILRLVDTDGDASLDKRTVVATGLPGSLVALARFDDIVITTSAAGGDESITFLRAGPLWDDPLVEIDRMHLGFVGAIHQSYALAVRPSPEAPDAFDLFFNLGAAGNDTSGPNVRASGPVQASLAPSSVYMITIAVTDDGLAFGEPVQVASGLRNASALVIDPGTGHLWIGENGIDGFEDPFVSFSADELNMIPAELIGSEVVDFGFPDSYVDYASGEDVGGDPPFANFRPLNGSESEGIAGMTIVPAPFPEPLAGGMLAGFHGQFDLVGAENEENPVRLVNLTDGIQVEIISNDAPGIGHLDSMASTSDAVYLADFCADTMTDSIACGSIYRLSATSE